MSVTTKRTEAAPASRRTTVRRFGPKSALVLAVAVVAGGILLVSTPDGGPPAPPAPPSRVTSADAWPNAQRATITGKLSDGSVFVPGHFLDARTAVGTASSPDGRATRLVVRRTDGSSRELRSLPQDRGPTFDSFAASDTHVVWVESHDGATPSIWVADLRNQRSPARQLTADTGAGLFYGAQYDLLINDGHVFWAAAPSGAETTEIRSVPLTGGSVSVRTETGAWILSAWPWLTDGNDQASRTRLRNLETKRDVEVKGSGSELVTCGPTWCRVTVVGDGGIARIELMRHDGSERKAIAGGTASAVGGEVAVLDRFELLFEPRTGAGPDSKTALLVYDITTSRTVEISPAVDSAFSRAGMLWWSTNEGDSIVWHTLDLRTV